MDRYWLLTTTTYGTWLPGDERGFVGPVRDAFGVAQIHNLPGTEYDRDLPKLREAARNDLRGSPIILTAPQAEAIFRQFYETATYRHWKLCAMAIMATHFHIAVGVLGDPDPEDVLGDFKSYASRILNRAWGRPASETWWTESGSKRKLRDDHALRAAIEYIRNQPNALLIWIAGENPPPELRKDFLPGPRPMLQ